MGNGITRDTFSAMDADAKLLVLFDYAQEAHRCACATEDKLDALEKRFDRRKLVDRTYATAGGFIGGALGALGIKFGG